MQGSKQRRLMWPTEHMQAGAHRLPQAAAHYLLTVLRLQLGDALELFDGAGLRATAHLQPGAQITVTAVQPCCEPTAALQVLVGLPEPERADWLVEKLTELGATTISFVHCERSQGKAMARPKAGRRQRWQRLAEAAARQSGRCLVPVVQPLQPLLSCVESIDGATHRWVASATGPAGHPPAAADAALAVVVGPPGGLTPDELQMLQQRGYTELWLSHFVLRTETAAVAAATTLLQRVFNR
jgi:16S rRNA (uracil1498-N3)-methyltransferase